MLAELLDFVFPPRCAGCEEWLDASAKRSLCARCHSAIAFIGEPICQTCGAPLGEAEAGAQRCGLCLKTPPSYGIARAIASYRAHAEQNPDVLASILRRHKYGLNQQLSRTFAEIVEERLPFAFGEYDAVVPVPLHGQRLRWRGFNQAALIAAVAARRVGCALDVTTLIRIKAAPPQTSADSDTRRRNVHRAFAARRPERFGGKRLLLVDDVFTTGATVNECARVLMEAGARCVDVFTLARAL